MLSGGQSARGAGGSVRARPHQRGGEPCNGGCEAVARPQSSLVRVVNYSNSVAFTEGFLVVSLGHQGRLHRIIPAPCSR